MDGDIWVESEPDMGSEFTFTAMLRRGSIEDVRFSTTAGPNGITEQADDFAAYTILLVEDVAINREIVLSLLESTRLKIECAENGLQAIEMFAKTPEKYSMIFMDIQMPVMDGFEATQKIRALETPLAKTIPILAMTANVFSEDIIKCLDAGMNDHVGKPLDLDEVISQLRKYLR